MHHCVQAPELAISYSYAAVERETIEHTSLVYLHSGIVDSNDLYPLAHVISTKSGSRGAIRSMRLRLSRTEIHA